MERGSDKHGPRQDDQLKAELSGMLGSAGGHREEWVDPEPPADDDPPRPDIDAGAVDVGAVDAGSVDADERMTRLRHDMDVANDSRFGDRDFPASTDE